MHSFSPSSALVRQGGKACQPDAGFKWDLLISKSSLEDVPHCFSRSSIKFQGHRSHGLTNRRFESSLSMIARMVTAIKSIGFALFKTFLAIAIN